MKAIYVSYDGALDPLGESQVLPYVLGLAGRGVTFSLITFEKPARYGDAGARERVRGTLASAGVRWLPQRYHARPRLPAKAVDVVTGARAIRRERARTGTAIVHCRGEIAMAMARLAGGTGRKVLYDMRGFFADERVKGHSWASGGIVDRAVRRLEAGNRAAADGIVVLTEAARDRLRSQGAVLPPLRVIPTCVDLERFRPATAAPEFAVVYGGSLGAAYPTREIVRFARLAAERLSGRALFLTPQVDAARDAGATADWCEVRAVTRSEMPGWLTRGRTAFCLYTPGDYLAATAPTKLGEALACGLPIAVNRGVGDLDRILGPEAGVLIDALEESSYRAAADRLAALAADPGTAARCRRLAEERFSLHRGLDAYESLYRELAG